jgi:large subunit ribosomal protein L22
LQLDVDELFVSEAYVGKNIVLKRWRARARGRVGKIQKPFSQLTIVVKENDKTEQIDITEEVQ